ncbi:hypothetical protein [Bacillus sp. Au-Bac7]|uniref:hypothetical protein n=1 Tax=Bacillus sp. Au-Bac7 TaxID=2906458 RepID=UPI001E62C471|nr:hypothetical protein [Bacillus sp. Au-Bac7]MCE4052035.1 hypothetical protein [Bacillus sp. Au-Bac7]
MPDMVFKGFSDYYGRNVCSVSFDNEYDNVRFQGAFNLENSNAFVQAVPSRSYNTDTNIVYTSGITEEQIRNSIKDLFGKW